MVSAFVRVQVVANGPGVACRGRRGDRAGSGCRHGAQTRRRGVGERAYAGGQCSWTSADRRQDVDDADALWSVIRVRHGRHRRRQDGARGRTVSGHPPSQHAFARISALASPYGFRSTSIPRRRWASVTVTFSVSVRTSSTPEVAAVQLGGVEMKWISERPGRQATPLSSPHAQLAAFTTGWSFRGVVIYDCRGADAAVSAARARARLTAPHTPSASRCSTRSRPPGAQLAPHAPRACHPAAITRRYCD